MSLQCPRKIHRPSPRLVARPFFISNSDAPPVSLESITPLPASSTSEPPKSVPVPDLSTLRQGWDSRQPSASSPVQPMAELPSLPVPTTHTTSEQGSIPEAEKIPTLPELAPLSGEVDFSIAGLDHLLASVYPEQAKKSPTMQASIGLESLPAVPAPVAASPRKQSAEKIPLMEFPTLGTPSTRPVARQTPTLDAMPSTATPNASLPLARDQFVFPVDAKSSAEVAAETKQPTPAPPVVTPPKEPAKKPAAVPPTARKPEAKTLEPQCTSPQIDRTRPPVSAPTPTATARPDYTDEDLHDALRPIIDRTVDKFLYTPTHGIHTYLEPMLRSTVRRAIAEQMDDVSPFQEAAGWDKFAWKMRALFSSRTYEEVLFDHTKRYQVEEVFLLRCHTRSLISYASNNPARHANTSKVQGTVKKIASKCSNKENGDSDSCIKWEENRHLMLRRGKHCILAAIVNGSSNAILRSDLDYALRQAEERFGKALEDENDIHLQILQPLLEGCLLIKAPSIAG